MKKSSSSNCRTATLLRACEGSSAWPWTTTPWPLQRRPRAGVSAPALALFGADGDALALRWGAPGDAADVVGVDVFREESQRWETVYEGSDGGCRIGGLAAATTYRVRGRRGSGALAKCSIATFCTRASAPQRPQLVNWISTPAETTALWSDRTAELRLGLPADVARLPAAATFVVEKSDAGLEDWQSCYRGRTPRCRVSGLEKGRNYLFRSHLASGGRAMTDFSVALVLQAPVIMPAQKPVARPLSASLSARPLSAHALPANALSLPPRPQTPHSVVCAPSDPDWQVAWCSERNRPFYHNRRTMRSQWTPPLQAWQ